MADQSCNVCGSNLVARYERVKDNQSGELFQIRTCSKCGLGHTLPVPGDLSVYYGPKYYGNRHSFTQKHRMARRLNLLQRAAKTLPAGSVPSKLLDIGCGDGSFLALAREHGFLVSGTELGDNSQPAKLGIEARQYIDDWSDDGPFDIVTMWHSLEHFPDVRRALESVEKLLAPSGVLIVAVPDFGGVQARAFGPEWVHLDVPRHLYHFDRPALDTLFETTGFKAFERLNHESAIDTFGWLQSALNVVLPTPNVLYDIITGKAADVAPGAIAISLMGAALLATPSVAATAATRLFSNGATQIAFAHRADAQHQS